MTDIPDNIVFPGLGAASPSLPARVKASAAPSRLRWRGPAPSR